MFISMKRVKNMGIKKNKYIYIYLIVGVVIVLGLFGKKNRENMVGHILEDTNEFDNTLIKGEDGVYSYDNKRKSHESILHDYQAKEEYMKDVNDRIIYQHSTKMIYLTGFMIIFLMYLFSSKKEVKELYENVKEGSAMKVGQLFK